MAKVQGKEANLEKIRDIILGPAFEAYEERLSQLGQTVENVRSLFRQQLDELEGSTLPELREALRAEITEKINQSLNELEKRIHRLERRLSEEIAALKQQLAEEVSLLRKTLLSRFAVGEALLRLGNELAQGGEEQAAKPRRKKETNRKRTVSESP